MSNLVVFFQAEDGIRDLVRSRGLGDVYKRQDYSRARDMMFKATDSKHAPWYVIRSDDKKRARLNCISHVLKSIPYKLSLIHI